MSAAVSGPVGRVAGLSAFLLALAACNAAGTSGPVPIQSTSTSPVQTQSPSPTATPLATSTPHVLHIDLPGEPPSAGKLVYDVISETTAPDGRAPYGDSYEINLLERPFLQDMTYVPDLDIFTFTVTKDELFWYVSVELVGGEPNNTLGIHYALELDTDYDGFGDYLIWATPPYSPKWETRPIQILADRNHDTGGGSPERSEAPLDGDGYETLVFNGGAGDSDPDLAWIRTHAGPRSTLQFAFKRSWSGMLFMLGALADAGLADPRQMDYVDRIEESAAGSPVRGNDNFPLGALFAIDTTCRAAFGLEETGLEPRICPPRPAPPRP